MSSKTYNPWPLGKLPKEFQRPEIDMLREAGYAIDDPREANQLFEDKLCEFTGAPFAPLVSSCTDGLFLALKALQEHGRRDQRVPIIMPARTYLSAPMSVSQAGHFMRFVDYTWSGMYQLDPLPVYDAAARFTKDMYLPGCIQVLSFQIKKRLPIGKGGAILCDNKDIADWIRKASFEGRDLSKPYDQDKPKFMGWNMYMTPEDAARGVLLLDGLLEQNPSGEFPDTMNETNYTDLRTYKVFRCN